jgi:F-type H+-transporting ATPase subunit epsilon
VAFDLSVVTPEGAVLELSVDSVVAPGSSGEFGVLTGHEAFLAPLSPGLLRCAGPGGDERIVVTDGFAEVTGERMTVLANAAERTGEIDLERAEAARARAQARIEGRAQEAKIDEVRALAALARAQARLAAARLS